MTRKNLNMLFALFAYCFVSFSVKFFLFKEQFNIKLCSTILLEGTLFTILFLGSIELYKKNKRN